MSVTDLDPIWVSEGPPVAFTGADLTLRRWLFEERWWRFMRRGLERRGVPAEAIIFTTGWDADDADWWVLTLSWNDPNGRPMRVVARDPRMIWARPGWFGWPAYHVGAKALRALG